MGYHTKKLEEIYKELSTDPLKGLDEEEARARLEQYGPNEIPKAGTWWDQVKIILSPLMSWLILIYLIGAIILYITSIFSNESDLSMIYTTLGIVFINVLIAIFQQIRATKKLNALRELSAPVCVVIRDGESKQIPARDLVVGDIIQLDLGDKIPADARIIRSSNLEVNEASLTGESEPVRKNQGQPLTEEDIPIAEMKNMVFLGTYITRGNGLAVVVATGGDTELGKIQKGLEETTGGEIPIRAKMNHFGKYLGLLVMAFWLISFSIIWIAQRNNPSLKVGELVYLSLNSAMDMMPINIPLLTTIVLITGVLFMAKTGVIVRNLAAVDSLGRVSVVCSDKTGTLTKSQMTVKNVWVDNQVFNVEGTGYQPEGSIWIANEDGSNKEQITDFTRYPYLTLLLQSGYFNNNAKIVEKDKDLGDNKIIKTWDAIGNPTEASLLVLYKKAFKREPDFEVIHEYPFSSDLKRMSKIVKFNGKIQVHSKGATSFMLERCSSIIENGKSTPLTGELKNKVMTNVEKFAAMGYRVLSLCYKDIEEKLPDDLEELRDKFESELTYLGFVTILDPPRDGVDEAVNICHNAGVNVIMITGDAPATARAIAKQIRIIESDDQLAITGNEIEDYIDKPEFDQIRVFARVSPEHKQIIVKKYQSDKKVVAMTGDGVNDALALSMADAGIAMGIQGTDVAKEAADMVISDDSFISIVKGIHQGRGIFSKIRAVVFFYIAINVFEGIVQFVLAVIMHKPYFLSPPFLGQWIWLSITLHMFPGLILTFDTISDDVMNEKPRDSEEILENKTFALLVIYGILLAIAMFVVYYLCISGLYGIQPGNIKDNSPDYLYTDYWKLSDYFGDSDSAKMKSFMDMAEAIGREPNLETLRIMGKTLTMLMTVLFFSESILVLQIRRANKSLIKSLKEDSNKLIYIIFGILYSVYLLILYAPRAQVWLGKVGKGGSTFNFMFMPLTALDWLVAFAISLITIVGIEYVKYIARKRGIVF